MCRGIQFSSSADLVTSSGPLRPYLSNKGRSTSNSPESPSSSSSDAMLLSTHNDLHNNMSLNREARAKTEAVTNILDYLLREYDKRIRPNFGSTGIKVGVGVYVNNILSMSESNMEFSIDFYFRQYWDDPRLKYSSFENDPGEESHNANANANANANSSSSRQTVSEIALTREFSDAIWQPDTFFSNEKRSYVPTATVHNEYIRLYSNGRVLKSTRLTLTAGCPMYLLYFPADIQPCRVEFGSYGYVDKDIAYYWLKGNSMEIWWEAMTLPQFEVKGHRQRNRTSVTAMGNYSHLYMEFLFERQLTFHLIQSYIPPTLVVIISWLVFWMGREVIVERMALGVTTVLTITTILMASNANSPKIGYLRSVDIYLGVCFALVFASLIESSVLGFLSRRLKKKLEKTERGLLAESEEAHSRQRRVEQQELLDDDNEKEAMDVGGSDRGNYLIRKNMSHNLPSQKKVSTSKLNPASLHRRSGGGGGYWRISSLDFFSRIFFPVGFAIFVILYWWFFVHAVKDTYLDWHTSNWDKIEECGWELRYRNQ